MPETNNEIQKEFPRVVLIGEVKEIKKRSLYLNGYGKPAIEMVFITINFGVEGGNQVGSIEVPGHRPIGTRFALTLVEFTKAMSENIAEQIENSK